MTPLLPGGTIGVLGGGQLGRMLAMAAHRLGYHLVVFDPDPASPAGQAADQLINASWEDEQALSQFAEAVDVATLEFENVPTPAARWIAERVPVRPHPDALAICQHRRLEKTFLERAGFPVGAFRIVHTLDALRQAVAVLGFPVVAKRTSFGYDGKGQAVLRSDADVEPAWKQIGDTELIIEKFIDFDCEVSVIVARSATQVVTYGPMRNTHARGILDISQYPALVPDRVSQSALHLAGEIAVALDYIGVLCIEFFVAKDGRVLVNEMAPRPHNSGHLSIEGFASSQFDQQARAVCNMPLGSNRALFPGVAMANLLGDLWSGGEPDWQSVLREPEAWLHLYGKASARPGRKMGHLTVAADTAEHAAQRAAALRARLVRGR